MLTLACAAIQGLKLLQDLLSIEVPLTLNEAFCQHHRVHCPKSEELDRECSKVLPQQRTVAKPAAPYRVPWRVWQR